MELNTHFRIEIMDSIMMKQRYGYFLLALFFAMYSNLNAQESRNIEKLDKPNVILIMTDDQGYGDLGFNGNPYIITPHLDQLFEESVRATNFHVSPTCTPTRGALMTGQYSNRVGTWHTIAGRSLLFENAVTMPQIFAENGYVTGMFGKWHLGDNYPFRAEDRGFQEVVRHGGGGVSQGPDFWGNDYFDDSYWHNGEIQQYTGYCTDVFFNEAMKFIIANSEKPFFTYLATNAPHGPLHVPEKYYNMYQDTEGILEAQKRFYGMITNIDDNIGKMLALLDDLGIAENTILIFMTDNGTANGLMKGNIGFNAGMRGTKGSEYDGGHRVPFAIRWPSEGLIGRNVDQLLAHIDVLPTLIDLAQLRTIHTSSFDGLSFAPLLRGEKANLENRTIITDSQRTRNLVKWRKSAVMQGYWRLVNGQELYNVQDDPEQKYDLSGRFPEIKERLIESYNTWWTSLKEQGINERYAYIKVGTSFEDPTRISSHDMFIYPQSLAWHQYGALKAVKGRGVLKVEVESSGHYKISLRRYPRESQLSINEVVPGNEPTVEVNSPMPASNNVNIREAQLYIADWSEQKAVGSDQQEIVFEGYLSAGKYDMTAYFIDKNGSSFPAYFVYFDKIDP